MTIQMARTSKDLHLKDYIVPISRRTCIMGILNVTPDSFSDGGEYLDPATAVERAKKMVDEGADIIDIGGESSRPGSNPVSADEEINRIIPVIKELKRFIDIPISVDTYKSTVASKALSEGASIVNDISALRGDPDMAGTIAGFDAGVVLMHMKGIPGSMQDDPEYDDIILEIYSYLSDSVDMAEKAGIDPQKIIVDPGIGFGKTADHNLLILRDLRRFEGLEKSILVGASRKSFIGKVIGKEVRERVFGSAAAAAIAVMNGADIIRVHDVFDMSDVTAIVDAVGSV